MRRVNRRWSQLSESDLQIIEDMAARHGIDGVAHECELCGGALLPDELYVYLPKHLQKMQDVWSELDSGLCHECFLKHGEQDDARAVARDTDGRTF